jgi:hypothetical protein
VKKMSLMHALAHGYVTTNYTAIHIILKMKLMSPGTLVTAWEIKELEMQIKALKFRKPNP